MRVWIAGAAGALGRLLVEQLLAEPDVQAIIGLDRRACRPPVPGMRFVRADLRQPEWRPLLTGADVVLYLAGLTGWPSRREPEQEPIESIKAMVRAVREARVRKLIVVNSALIYGPQPPGPLPESAAVRGHRMGIYARSRAYVEDYLDMVAREAAEPVLTRLHCAWIVGPHHPRLPRYLRANRVLACGHEGQRLQVVHEEDVIAALRLAIRRDLPGVAHVCADEGLAWRDVSALLHHERSCVPLAWLVQRARWRWWWRRPDALPPSVVRALYHDHFLEARTLRRAGWTPRYSTAESLAAGPEVG